jgi:glycerol-3-phosphate cytidylyltransferase
MSYNVLYTGGTFDLFHAGHVNFLKRCNKIAAKIVVSLNTDEFIESYKGKPPICSYADRKAILESCVYVDEVIENVGGADSKPSILQVKPNIIAIGTDWAKKDYYAQMQFTQQWLDVHDILLVYIPYTEHVSTTLLKQRVKDY